MIVGLAKPYVVKGAEKFIKSFSSSNYIPSRRGSSRMASLIDVYEVLDKKKLATALQVSKALGIHKRTAEYYLGLLMARKKADYFEREENLGSPFYRVKVKYYYLLKNKAKAEKLFKKLK